jgi:hypothetical protein
MVGESDGEWSQQGEMAVAPEGEKKQVEAGAGQKEQEKVDTAERDVRNWFNCNENLEQNNCYVFFVLTV